MDPEMALLWLFDNLRVEPFGALPVANLTSKGGPTIIKNYEQVASYNWHLEEVQESTENGTANGEQPTIKPTMIVPGAPREMVFWIGGRLRLDEGYLLYDVNHLKVPQAPMDPIFLAVKRLHEIEEIPEMDFQQFDFVTDSLNLQKLFAFAKAMSEEEGGGGGMFRIDLERVGRTILMTRVEACDVVAIDFETFDRAFRHQNTHPATNFTAGPYQQISSFTFGQLKILVRFEADCADYTKLAGNAGSPRSGFKEPGPDVTEDRKPFDLNPDVLCADFGKKQRYTLLTTTTYPANRGFPFFTYAQMFFTGIDQLLVGWWKGADDFSKPAQYAIADVNKMIKPPPYVQLSKTYDCLVKVMNLLRKNREGLRISLLWKGNEFIEIYEKAPYVPGAISDGVRAYLKSQVKEQVPGDLPRTGNEEEEEEHDEAPTAETPAEALAIAKAAKAKAKK